MSTVLSQASHQWATRPDDQRFVSLAEMHAQTLAFRQQSRAKVVSSAGLRCVPVEGDHKALQIVGPNGGACDLTHWSFDQVAKRAAIDGVSAAGYLRQLPAPLAADCINYGLIRRSIDDVGVLLHKPDDGPATLRAMTGPNYGRVWNSDIIESLMARFGDGLTGAFRIPGEFGKPVPVTRENTTLYASDRDCFVFLCDEVNRIEIPNRRNGEAGSLARGFFLWNSQEGGTSLGLMTFLFDYACRNRNVWGAEGMQQFRIRHTASAPDKWIAEVAPALEQYRQSSTRGIVTLIEDARAKRIDDVDAFLATRFSKPMAASIKAAHFADEGRPIETLWDASNGVTALARGITHQAERVELERKGGLILALAA